MTIHDRSTPWLAAALLLLATAAGAVEPRLDGRQVVGPDECGECHKHEVAVWRETKHQKAFYELARKEEAKKIAKAMGIKRLKRDSACIQCHFTMQEGDGADKAVAGVSCESCHGAAREWFEVHNDYGGKEVKKEQESPAHREQRIAAIDRAGMIRPHQLYDLAENCYQCHLVLNEELVNTGGHKAGSEFELVAWSQGENRHNFYRSADGKENVESAVERRRRLLLVGAALDLEYSLRGVAGAAAKAKYAVTMAKRAARGIQRLEAINAKLGNAELAAMIEAAKGAKLKLNNAAELTAAAERVKSGARKLAELKGETLAALDPLLPKAADYKGVPGEARGE